ncbi:MAG: LysM peptidoglycan-binding domain-containing protein [Deltaproteobacteria bacterium]|nr:LysM peptidoglycan-binding domain-containing protein [Deltaproteobacteria bacterium]
MVPGDNLVTLAKRYGLSSNDIATANNLQNKNKLKPGQTLIIPAKKAKDTKVAKNKATKKSAAAVKPKKTDGKSAANPKAKSAKSKT